MTMHTAKLLEGMKDSAAFEQLATCILRKVDKNVESIIHLGVNAKGKTIKSSTDGFCKVPYSDPPHFIWIQHTTEDRSTLQRKWLDMDSGDLFAASREANQLRPSFPTAIFTVVLSTNQRIPSKDGKSNLASKVYVQAKQLGLEVVIREQSIYADFLDADRDGHWLRKLFFSTEAQLLSGALLSNICEKSLTEYKKRQVTPPDNWISRQLDKRIIRAAIERPFGFTLLMGESGFGKSAAAYRFFEHHLRAGRYGLFIPENIVQTAISLEDAIWQVLHRLYPSLSSTESAHLSSLLGNNSPFLIIIDDINNSTDPTELTRKLANWVAPPFIILCPIWPRFWKPIELLEKKSNVNVIAVDRLTLDEAVLAVESLALAKGHNTSRINARTIASKMQCDPLLIGLIGDLIAQNSSLQILELADDVVEQYTKQYVNDAINASSSKFFDFEVYEAINALMTHALNNRQLYSPWRTIEEWFANTPKWLEILRVLCRHEKLCKVTTDEIFQFRHDRVLVHFAVKCIGGLLNNLSKYRAIVAEPYYAEFVGMALIKFPQPEHILNEILQLHPLALFVSIREFGTPRSDYHWMIIRKVKFWMDYSVKNFMAPESVRAAVANTLLNTDSPIVLELANTTFGLEVHWLGHLARFRNGDALGGAQVCRIYQLETKKDHFFVDIVEHTKRYHTDFGNACHLSYATPFHL